MIKYYYPDGTHCYRALHTTHAAFRNEEGNLIARAMHPDNSELYEFQIVGFEMLEPGVRYERRQSTIAIAAGSKYNQSNSISIDLAAASIISTSRFSAST